MACGQPSAISYQLDEHERDLVWFIRLFPAWLKADD
jgi:hypothetical protein